MSKSFVPAAVAIALLTLGGAAVHASEAKPTVSPASAKTLKAAQDAATAKNFGETIAKANETLANPKKTPYDALVSYQLLTYAYAQQGNAAETLKAMQGQIDTGALSPADLNKQLKLMQGFTYQNRQYDKSIDYGNQLVRSGAADAEVQTTIGQSYFQLNKFADAAKTMSALVSDQEKRGQAPRESALLLLNRSYDKLDNKTAASDTLEKLVVHYPKPEYWDAVLYSVRRDPKLSERQTLHVYRLMQATKTLKRATDYTEMADLANNAGMPGEAQRVLDEGLGTNVFTVQTDKDRATRLLGSAKRQSDGDKAGLAKLEKDAQAAKTGEMDMVLGMSLFGQADYAKAGEAFSRALQKGGLKDASDVQLMLGTAQIRAGNKAEAAKTFRAIKSDNPLTQRVAKLWTLYVS